MYCIHFELNIWTSTNFLLFVKIKKKRYGKYSKLCETNNKFNISFHFYPDYQENKFSLKLLNWYFQKEQTRKNTHRAQVIHCEQLRRQTRKSLKPDQDRKECQLKGNSIHQTSENRNWHTNDAEIDTLTQVKGFTLRFIR